MKKNTRVFIIIGILGVLLLSFSFWASRTTISTSPSTISVSSISNTAEDNTDESPFFIERLREREYEPSQITIGSTIANNGSYSGHIFSYLSDGLKIYGRMNVPNGDGAFPVVVLNHGYFNQSTFMSGDGTQTMADILARNGYLTLASDYRGFGKSENDSQGSRGHNPNYAIDVLNLLASVKNADKADPDRIGMWGHSMGGEVALRVVEAADSVKALVLWAPTATRASDNRGFAAGRHMQGINPTPDSSQDSAAPMNYLRYIQAPISLHQGLADTEVNPEGSKELNEALKREGKTVEYFEYPGQDHNFRNLGWDVISKRTVDFFDRYLK